MYFLAPEHSLLIQNNEGPLAKIPFSITPYKLSFSSPSLIQEYGMDIKRRYGVTEVGNHFQINTVGKAHPHCFVAVKTL